MIPGRPRARPDSYVNRTWVTAACVGVQVRRSFWLTTPYPHKRRDMMTLRTIRIALVALISVSAINNLSAQRALSAAEAAAASNDDSFWKVINPKTDPELSTAALSAHQALCQRTGADACIVIHHDRIVQEWYGPLYTTPMPGMSSTKSVSGLLTGMLIADGRIKNVDAHVCTFISSWCDGRRAQVTLRHVLTMTSGLPMMRDSSVGFKSDKNGFVTHLIPTSVPGTKWDYSNEGAQLLSPILDAAAKEPIQNYARRRLFEPLGMHSTRLHVLRGQAWTYADMETTARDFARIGVLALHHGKWNGKQIVNADWFAQSTKPSQTLNPRYGLLWWIDPEIRGYATHGYLDTDVHVIPDLDLVMVRMQSKPVTTARDGDYEREGMKMFRTIVRAR